VTLCEHVETEEDRQGTLWVVRGTATPGYGWSRELQADVPLLRCSVCPAVVQLPGTAVGRRERQLAPNRKDPGWELL